jgi:hypothetical protein
LPDYATFLCKLDLSQYPGKLQTLPPFTRNMKKKNLKNFRPVSLLSIPGEVMERYVPSTTYMKTTFLENRQLTERVAQQQHGY